MGFFMTSMESFSLGGELILISIMYTIDMHVCVCHVSPLFCVTIIWIDLSSGGVTCIANLVTIM